MGENGKTEKRDLYILIVTLPYRADDLLFLDNEYHE